MCITDIHMLAHYIIISSYVPCRPKLENTNNILAGARPIVIWGNPRFEKATHKLRCTTKNNLDRIQLRGYETKEPIYRNKEMLLQTGIIIPKISL